MLVISAHNDILGFLLLSFCFLLEPKIRAVGDAMNCSITVIRRSLATKLPRLTEEI